MGSIKKSEIACGNTEVTVLRETGNFNIIEEKLRARKRSWDEMLQSIAFIGSSINPGIHGLLNQDGITINTTTITKYISTMTPAEIQGFAANLIKLFRANCDSTAVPNTFLMPEVDKIGCAQSNDAQFQLRNRLDYIKECFTLATDDMGRVGEFKILPTAYANPNIMNGIHKGKYLLYNRNPDVLVYDAPVDFTVINNEDYQRGTWTSLARGQIGSVRLFRHKEFMEFINPNA